jgi:hypothetical protein
MEAGPSEKTPDKGGVSQPGAAGPQFPAVLGPQGFSPRPPLWKRPLKEKAVPGEKIISLAGRKARTAAGGQESKQSALKQY